MEIFESIVNVGNQYVWSTPSVLPWLIVLLLCAGLFVTLRLGFIQLRKVKHAILVVAGRYDDPDDPGDVNHFQALSTALSATVGIGNIAGVATAIHYGGPGALFWMWVTALFGMALKFAECTLSVYYRKFDDKGESAGGPMYYIEYGLGKSWKPLAVFFAFCAIISSFGGGNMNQANTVAVSASSDLGLATWIVGAILVVVVGAVILGGIRSIARVASAIAPTMAVFYVIGALIVLIMHAGDVPGAFGTIFSQAFNPTAGVGGSVAGIFSVTLLWGVKRGLFSNEAGQGSAPIAHAAAKTNEPVREGAVAMLGPLIDTLIICTMTGLVIVITGVWDQKKHTEVALPSATMTMVAPAKGQSAPPPVKQLTVTDGVVKESVAFEINDGAVVNPKIVDFSGKGINAFIEVKSTDDGLSLGKVTADPLDDKEREQPITKAGDLYLHGNALQNSSALTAWGFQEGLRPIGDWGNWIVTICVFLFAISTMISWSYYGDRCVTYLFGAKYVIYYRLVYIGFVYLGATTALEVVWAYGDLALGLMTVPNLIAVVLLMPKVVSLSRDYFRRMDEPVPKATAKSSGDSDD